MRVNLLFSTPEPEKAVAIAARLCYAPIGAAELSENISPAQIKALIKFLVDSGHHSAIEHASFTFAIEGISRACSHQLVRHRLASFNQQSQRYVSYEKPNIIIPPQIKTDSALRRRFDKACKAAFDAYREMIEAGVEAEDARYLLPNATETKIVLTMNARELLHFFSVRCCNRAQWEIRELADKMLKMVSRAAPTIFVDAGPGCRRGPCPEGKMTCGKPRRKSQPGSRKKKAVDS